MLDQLHGINTTQDAAAYAVYQGRLLDDRLTLIAGIRSDRSWNKDWEYNPKWNSDGTHFQPTANSYNPIETKSAPSNDTTHQYGADFRLTKDGSLSLYAMSSEASQPNYSGALDFNMVPLPSSLGKDKEIGLKFDLFDHRLSGTISKFRIDRTRIGVGDSGQPWWAPVNDPAGSLFNPNKPIVYNVTDLSPDLGSGSSWNSFAKAMWPAFNTALAAGAITKATPAAKYGTSPQYYINASTTAGATFMDYVFAQMVAQHTGYSTWLWNYDNLTNNTSADQQSNHGGRSQPLGADRSSGWDGQLMYSPTDEIQIVASFSHTEKVVVHAAQWVQIPNGYNVDRWAIWYAPGWPQLTPGQTAKDGFTDPNNTSTNVAYGDGLALDDTPKNQGALWVHYEFPKVSRLHGLHLGVGVDYQGSATIFPLYSTRAYDANGNVVFLNSKTKTLYNGMVRYEFKVKGHEASVQLNIDNVLNNTDYYGQVANAPRRFSLNYEQKF